MLRRNTASITEFNINFRGRGVGMGEVGLLKQTVLFYSDKKFFLKNVQYDKTFAVKE
jgi:hypothetical protein